MRYVHRPDRNPLTVPDHLATSASHFPTAEAVAVSQQGAIPHPKVFSLSVLPLLVVLSVVGSIVGMQLIVALGVTPNTGLLGAMVAMGVGRIPVAIFHRYRSPHIQNLAQSAVSAACFGAANAMLLPIGIPWLLGRHDLVMPLFAGVLCATFLDAFMLYRLFGTSAFPVTGAWPAGIAIAETIRTGDSGGRRVLLMGSSVALGLAGALAGIPMAAFGTALIGNAWALLAFGIGLLVSGYGLALPLAAKIAACFPAIAPDPHLLPHGMMMGASLVALAQVGWSLTGRDEHDGTFSGSSVRAGLAIGASGFLIIASLLALISGIASGLSPMMLVGFVLYAAFAAFLHEMIVGLAAMHSGWFPAFAIALITLLLGGFIGFPMPALALLAGFTCATGPAFADMGYDLKAGFLLRGEGANHAFEMEGRRQQLLAACVALSVAGGTVFLSWPHFFQNELFPPPARVYAVTIKGSVQNSIAQSLTFWALPGAILQAAGGSRRQLGVLLATGLLIARVPAGWAVLAGLLLRVIWFRLHGHRNRSTMQVFAGGVIAGDAFASFAGSFFSMGHNQKK